MTDRRQQPDPDAGEPDPAEFAAADTSSGPASPYRFWLAVVAVVAVVAIVATFFSFLLFSGSGSGSDTTAAEPTPVRTDTGTGAADAPGPALPDGTPADAEQTAQIEAVTAEFIAAYNAGDLSAMRATICAEQADQLEIAGTPAQQTVLDGLGHVFVDGDRATARADLGQAVAVDQAGDVLVIQEAVLDYRDEDGWKLC